VSHHLRIVVCGMIAQYPLGGVTWDYVQYAAGLARLGHDVYYVEDTGQWPFNPSEGGTGEAADFNVSYLAAAMARFGLADRWAYRFPWQSQWYGLPDDTRNDAIASADLVINVSGCLANLDEYRGRARLVYIDSDPVFTQVKLARGQQDFRRYVDAHDVHFSFGERLGPLVPDSGIAWRPTRQPILLDEWLTDTAPQEKYTTVMNWSSYKPVEYQGRRFGQKDIEFAKYMDLPAAIRPAHLELAMNAAGKMANAPVDLLRRKGWSIVSPDDVAADADQYRSYVQGSKGEWSVAKNGYVVGRPGWFSCRSACYLAAGRPVVAEDTGFGEILPTGAGLFAFDRLDEAVAAIRSIEADYGRHSRAARAIAEQYFDSDKVLDRLVEEAMNAVE
jgi:hypothetical protein